MRNTDSKILEFYTISQCVIHRILDSGMLKHSQSTNQNYFSSYNGSKDVISINNLKYLIFCSWSVYIELTMSVQFPEKKTLPIWSSFAHLQNTVFY